MQVWDLFGKISLEGDNQVNSAIDKISNKFKSVGSNITNFGKTLTLGVSVPLLAVGAKMVSLASDLEEVKNVVNVTFGSTAKSVIDWSTTLKTKFGMVQLESLKYVGSMGQMLKSSGLSATAAETMAKKMVELTGDMSSFYNLSHEEVWEKIRSGMAGETEPLKVLGINMNVANMEAYALAEGIKKPWKEMSQAEQTQLRYNYLLKQTADAQGDFSRTSEGFANRLRIFQLSIEELGTKLGAIMLPSVNAVLGKLVEWIDKMNQLDLSDQKLILFIGALGIVIPPLIIVLGLFVTAIGSLLSPVGLVIGALGFLAAGFVASQIQSQGLEGFIQSLIIKMGQLKDFVMGTLVPALVYLATGEGLEKVQNSSIITRDKVEQLRAKMHEFKEKLMDVWDWIIKVKDICEKEFTPTLNSLKGLWNELKEAGKNVANVIKAIGENSGTAKTQISGVSDTTKILVDSLKTVFSWGNKVLEVLVAVDKWGKSVNKAAYNTPVIGSIMRGGDYLLGLDHNALGTTNAQGGWSVVGEHGPELTYLQQGTRVFDANTTKSILNNNNSSNTTNVFNINMDISNLKDILTIESFTNMVNREAITRGGY